MNDGGRSGGVALIATGLLIFFSAAERTTHVVRDDESYRAGYSAASHTPGMRPGAFADASNGMAMCDGLLRAALDGAEQTAFSPKDFHAGCTQAVRDAIE